MRRPCVFQPVYACSEGSLAEGLRFFATHEGPYAVHCQEGRDRTGVVAARAVAPMRAAAFLRVVFCTWGAPWSEFRVDS